MKNRGFEIISKYKDENITLPKRATSKSAGYDLASIGDMEILPGEMKVVETGLKAYMEEDEFLGIHIRSSLAFKHRILLVNGTGIIDADYYNNESNEGHIMIGLVNMGTEIFKITKGMRIAQGIFYKYLLTDEKIEANEKRHGGFGSTGE